MQGATIEEPGQTIRGTDLLEKFLDTSGADITTHAPSYLTRNLHGHGQVVAQFLQYVANILIDDDIAILTILPLVTEPSCVIAG
ncbi:hypothetical protein C1H66_08580 [Halomonas heilongjiangensis]|uniref:Uncharacterized protein n=1 Tax=Halomonas heilongjiangensis TaxID=1387883 RepID=A0A2N7TPM3_9GAMM|nr:hypothetical protein C1H66_08580 [Halomonas heilongjiangensis]